MNRLGADIYTFFHEGLARGVGKIFSGPHATVKTEEAAMRETVRVIIYSKPDCHLCEEAKAVMLAAGCSDLFTIEEVNIEGDVELLAQYRYDIPVIIIDGIEAFRHRLIAEEFKAQILRRSEG